MTATYTYTTTREGEWWVLTVEGIGTTQVRSLRRASAQVRDMIAATLDLNPDDIQVEARRAETAEPDNLCGARTRYGDPDYQPVPVPPQTVTCIRNGDHPGLHSGVARDDGGDAVFYHWND